MGRKFAAAKSRTELLVDSNCFKAAAAAASSTSSSSSSSPHAAAALELALLDLPSWKEGVAALWKNGTLVGRRNRGCCCCCCCIREVEKPWMWREERAAIWEAVGRSKEEAIRESRSELSAESSELCTYSAEKNLEDKPES